MQQLPERSLLAAVLAVIATSLQGCVFGRGVHNVGQWKQNPNYLESYAFKMPGSDSIKRSRLNSCETPGVLSSLQCSGRGHCVAWFDSGPESLSFCKCEAGFAGPECQEVRKSQITAFSLSVFFGMFGADQFYLGYWRLGIVKLLTLGGAGAWWLYDVVRIGSSAVATANGFRVAAEVQHDAFVLVILSMAAFIGFAISIWSLGRQRRLKSRELALIQASGSEAPKMFPSRSSQPTVSSGTSPGAFSGYGSTMLSPASAGV
mmetsp:Transcript_56001/g.114255  ORF Transcript_56001/g.114255 Transcript_56001/m.114255 type:complete len:261 (-) Transcript_56001:68-850(-)